MSEALLDTGGGLYRWEIHSRMYRGLSGAGNSTCGQKVRNRMRKPSGAGDCLCERKVRNQMPETFPGQAAARVDGSSLSQAPRRKPLPGIAGSFTFGETVERSGAAFCHPAAICLHFR